MYYDLMPCMSGKKAVGDLADSECMENLKLQHDHMKVK